MLALAAALEVAGEDRAIVELLRSELDRLPPGAARVRAYVHIADAGGTRDAETHLRARARRGRRRPRAAADGARPERDPPGDRVAASARRRRGDGGHRRRGVGGGERLHAGDRAGRARLGAAACAAPPIADLVERYDALDTRGELFFMMGRVVAQRLAWRGELRAARELHEQLLAAAEARGEGWSVSSFHLHLCELALRAGDWDEAERHARRMGPPVRRRAHQRAHAGPLRGAARGRPRRPRGGRAAGRPRAARRRRDRAALGRPGGAPRAGDRGAAGTRAGGRGRAAARRRGRTASTRA